MSNILEFTGEYHTRVQKSKRLADSLSVELCQHATEMGIDTSNPQFVYDFAWIVKFIEVMVDNDMGVANKLAKLMENAQLET